MLLYQWLIGFSVTTLERTDISST